MTLLLFTAQLGPLKGNPQLIRELPAGLVEVHACRNGKRLTGLGLSMGSLTQPTARLFTMRRWIAFMLLALLPLQFSWAAVAVYCGHELPTHAGEQQHVSLNEPLVEPTVHLGHHEHTRSSNAGHTDARQIADWAGAEDPVGTKVPVDADLDCGQCHAGCCYLPTALGPLTAGAPHASDFTSCEGRFRTLSTAPPDRPQWLPLA